MSTVDTREHKRFPVLNPAQIETARRFASGPEVRFAPGEMLYAVGDHDAPAWLVVAGSIEVMRRDGLDAEAPITTHGVGQFSGEVNQLAGRPDAASEAAGEHWPADGFAALRERDSRITVSPSALGIVAKLFNFPFLSE